jgi:hypothetical protein
MMAWMIAIAETDSENDALMALSEMHCRGVPWTIEYVVSAIRALYRGLHACGHG